MSIRLTISGIPVECDSADDALALIQKATSLDGMKPCEREKQPQGEPESPNYQAFWSVLDEEPRAALRALRDASTKLDTETLARQMSVDPSRIKYAVRSIRSAAAKANIEPSDVLCTTPAKIDGRTKSEYGMSDAVKKALAGM